MSVADQEANNNNIITGQLRNDNPLIDWGSNSTTKAAKNQREYLRAYFSSETGSVS
ncbi:hypothetical protein DPMN_042952 [Dreissena polymorpha]|uniref:Uncharacterized protein n=1 Tax=Dreissena polymorpha TaxID=45954 RepID=A0A9D4HXD1_DREPO|nr:hypothetical protein DPMN_042952 [Dreissena polymorpha]